MSPVRIGVIGGGHLGKIHTRLLAGISEYQLVAVAEPISEIRDSIAEQFKVDTVADYHVLAGKVDAMIIASPTTLHYSMASWALRHGLHTFVEKPLVQTSSEAAELHQLARKQGCVLQVGHVEQFNPAWTAAARYLGQPKLIEATRESGYTGRSTDIGVVLDLMIHDLDLIVKATSSPVVRVDATGMSILGQHEDIAQARVEFASGCVANIRASRVSRNMTRRMQVFSQESMADIDFGAGTADIVEPTREVLSRHRQADNLPNSERLRVKDELFTSWMPHTKLDVQPCNAIELELRDFLNAIRTGSQPLVSGEQAHRVLELAEQILFSLRASDARSTQDHKLDNRSYPAIKKAA